MSFAAVKGQFWITYFFTVKKEGIFVREGFGKKFNFTLEDLGFTQKNQVRTELITKIFKIGMISFKTLNVPGHAVKR